MAKRGVFVSKILFSLLDFKEKSPRKVANEWNDLIQEKYYRKHCLSLSKKKILNKKLIRRIPEEYFKDMKIKKRFKEYNSYSLNFNNFIKYMVKAFEEHIKEEFKANIKISKEDIELLKEYYKSDVFQINILPQYIKSYKPSILHTITRFSDRTSNEKKEEIIIKMENFWGKYFPYQGI